MGDTLHCDFCGGSYDKGQEEIFFQVLLHLVELLLDVRGGLEEITLLLEELFHTSKRYMWMPMHHPGQHL